MKNSVIMLMITIILICEGCTRNNDLIYEAVPDLQQEIASTLEIPTEMLEETESISEEQSVSHEFQIEHNELQIPDSQECSTQKDQITKEGYSYVDKQHNMDISVEYPKVTMENKYLESKINDELWTVLAGESLINAIKK